MKSKLCPLASLVLSIIFGCAAGLFSGETAAAQASTFPTELSATPANTTGKILEAVGHINGGYSPNLVIVQNDYTYVNLGTAFVVVDVHDPTHPYELSRIHTDTSNPGHIDAMAVANGFAYLLTRDNKLIIIDLAQPAYPQIVYRSGATNEFLGDVYLARVYGNHLYVSWRYFDGICLGCVGHIYQTEIMDISIKNKPKTVGSLTDREAIDIRFTGSRAFVAYFGTFEILDISDPTKITLLGTLDGGGYRLALTDQYVYLTSEHGYRLIDISDPSHPQQKLVYEPITGTVTDIALSGHTLYLTTKSTTGGSGVYVIDISDPLNPVAAGSFGQTTSYAIKVSNGYAYIGGTAGLSIYSLEAPLTPLIRGQYTVLGEVYDAVVRDSKAYLATGEGVWIFDLHDLSKPTMISFLNINTLYAQITLQDDHLFLYTMSTLYVIDVKTPAQPKLLTQFSSSFLDTKPHQISAVNQKLYLVDENNLSIFETATPTSPYVIRSVDTLSQTLSFALNPTQPHAYWITRDKLRVMDIIDPTNPIDTGALTTTKRFVSDQVAVDNNYLFALTEATNSPPATIKLSMLVIDATNPASPIQISVYEFTKMNEYERYTFQQIVVSTHYASVMHGNKLDLLDITDPANITLFASFGFPPNSRLVTAVDENLFVQGIDGLTIYRMASTVIDIYLPLISDS